MQIPNPYASKDYRLLVAFPIILILVAAFFVTRVPQGVDVKGGLLISLQTQGPVDTAVLKQKLLPFSEDVEIRAFSGPAGNGYEIELGASEKLAAAEQALSLVHDLDLELVRAEQAASFANNSAEKAAADAKVSDLERQVLSESGKVLANVGSTAALPAEAHDAAQLADAEYGAAQSAYSNKIMDAVRSVVTVKTYSLKEIGASLSKYFFSQIQQIMLYSFALGSIVVFLVFRSLVPSFIVIFAAVADVFIALGGMGLFGVPLTLASTAALLMLVGFSLDTDILLTIRVLKRSEGTIYSRAFEAMKTGFVMNATAITAFGVLAIIALWLNVPTYFQIGSVVVMGAFADFATTWCANAVTLLWYAERKEKKHAK